MYEITFSMNLKTGNLGWVFFVSLIFINFNTSYSKPRKVKFGDINISDFTDESYKKLDSTASAVVLYEKGHDEVKVDGTTRYRHLRIKILNKGGLEYAQTIISYFKGYETFSKFNGCTYNLNGDLIEKTEISKDNTFKEKVIYDLTYKTIAFPNVKEGSIIELEYKLYIPQIRPYFDWVFQYEIPVLYSEYKFESETFKKYFISELEFLKFVKGDIMNHTTFYADNHFILENLKPLQKEIYTGAKKDYEISIQFIAKNTLANWGKKSGTWEDLCENLINNYFKTFEFVPNEIKNSLKPLLTNVATESEKLDIIYSYFQKGFKVNEFKSAFKEESFSRTNQLKSGNVSDINMLLLQTLKEFDIEAYPVLLSTKDNGKILKSMPIPYNLNYSVVAVKSKETGEYILLDATDKDIKLGYLPEYALNGEGLIVKKVPEWIDLSGKSKFIEKRSITVQLDKSILSVECQDKLQGYANFIFSKKIRTNTHFIDDYFNAYYPTWEVKNTTLTGNNKLILKYSLQKDINNYDRISLSPYSNMYFDTNPFVDENRTLPIDFSYKHDVILVYNINLPEGYRIESAPENINLSMPDNSAKFSNLVKVEGNSLQLIYKLKIDRTLFFVEEYDSLREFFSTLIKIQNQKIVFTKI